MWRWLSSRLRREDAAARDGALTLGGAPAPIDVPPPSSLDEISTDHESTLRIPRTPTFANQHLSSPQAAATSTELSASARTQAGAGPAAPDDEMSDCELDFGAPESDSSSLSSDDGETPFVLRRHTFAPRAGQVGALPEPSSWRLLPALTRPTINLGDRAYSAELWKAAQPLLNHFRTLPVNPHPLMPRGSSDSHRAARFLFGPDTPLMATIQSTLGVSMKQSYQFLGTLAFMHSLRWDTGVFYEDIQMFSRVNVPYLDQILPEEDYRRIWRHLAAVTTDPTKNWVLLEHRLNEVLRLLLHSSFSADCRQRVFIGDDDKPTLRLKDFDVVDHGNPMPAVHDKKNSAGFVVHGIFDAHTLLPVGITVQRVGETAAEAVERLLRAAYSGDPSSRTVRYDGLLYVADRGYSLRDLAVVAANGGDILKTSMRDTKLPLTYNPGLKIKPGQTVIKEKGACAAFFRALPDTFCGKELRNVAVRQGNGKVVLFVTSQVHSDGNEIWESIGERSSLPDVQLAAGESRPTALSVCVEFRNSNSVTAFPELFNSIGISVLTESQGNALWHEARRFRFTSKTVAGILTKVRLAELRREIAQDGSPQAGILEEEDLDHVGRFLGDSVGLAREPAANEMPFPDDTDYAASHESDVEYAESHESDSELCTDSSEEFSSEDDAPRERYTLERARTEISALPQRVARDEIDLAQLDDEQAVLLAEAAGARVRKPDKARQKLAEYVAAEPAQRPFLFGTVATLREACRSRGHPVSGNRTALLARLVGGNAQPRAGSRASVEAAILRSTAMTPLSGAAKMATKVGQKNERHLAHLLLSADVQSEMREEIGLQVVESCTTGLVADSLEDWRATSPDRLLVLARTSGSHELGVAEFKTRVKANTLDAARRTHRDAMRAIGADPRRRCCAFSADSADARRFFAKRDEALQVLHHASVVGVNSVLFVVAGDCRTRDAIVGIYLVRFDRVLRRRYDRVLRWFFDRHLSWAYASTDEEALRAMPRGKWAAAIASVPYAVDMETLMSTFLRWRALRDLRPLPLPAADGLKLREAVVYNRTKSGSDTSSRMFQNNKSRPPSVSPSSVLYDRHLRVAFLAHHRLTQLFGAKDPTRAYGSFEKFNWARNRRSSSKASLRALAAHFFFFSTREENSVSGQAEQPVAPNRRHSETKVQVLPCFRETNPASSTPPRRVSLGAAPSWAATREARRHEQCTGYGGLKIVPGQRLTCDFCDRRGANWFCGGCCRAFCSKAPSARPELDRSEVIDPDDRDDERLARVHAPRTKPGYVEVEKTCYFRAHRGTARLESFVAELEAQEQDERDAAIPAERKRSRGPAS